MAPGASKWLEAIEPDPGEGWEGRGRFPVLELAMPEPRLANRAGQAPAGASRSLIQPPTHPHTPGIPPAVVVTLEKLQWSTFSSWKREASFRNTAPALRIKVVKSWMWM